MAHERQREQLETLLERLTQRSKALESDLRRKEGPLSRDWEEQSIELENDEVLAQLAKDAPTQITRIRAALNRMDAGDYGVCAACGREIPQARLDILPYAITCLRCAELAEARRHAR
ncbi:MAG: TraR/DksA family transcriptional regulator [Vicinamibacterales bacterium]